MLEPYRHGGGGPLALHHPNAPFLPTRSAPPGGLSAISDWTDVLLPRGSSFNIWELSPNKLKTAAVAFTFVVTAGYISMLAAGGLLAILITGAVVTCCVLLTVLTCASLIALVVTGVPVGYAIMRLLAARSSSGGSQGRGAGGGMASAAAGVFSSMFGGQHQQEHGGHGGHFGSGRPGGVHGWAPRTPAGGRRAGGRAGGGGGGGVWPGAGAVNGGGHDSDEADDD